MTTPNPTNPPGPRSPLAEIVAVALPSAATMLSYPVMQIVDRMMVGRIGVAAVSAQGNGGLSVWVLGATVVGMMSVVNTFVAQSLGAGRDKSTAAYAWNGIWLCAAAAVLMLGLIPLAPAFFRLFGHAPELTRLETIYAQISLGGAFFMMASRTVHQFFYGVHRPGVVLGTAVVAHATNVVLNYALIFGKFGLPELGVAGAAIGTVTATAVEFSLPMLIFLSPSYAARFGTRSRWKPRLGRAKDLLRLGWPAGLQSGNEMVCWEVFMLLLVGRFGAEHSDASWYALSYMMLSFMPALGISFGITAVVGRWIGAGDPAEAARRAMVGVWLTVAYMALCAVVMVVFREPLIRAFISDQYAPEEAARVLRIGSMIMICAAVFQIFDALGIAMTGALRGAGDTVVPGVLTAVYAWTVLLGGGWLIVTYREDLGSMGPWAAAAAYIIVLGVTLALRWRSGAWRKIRIVDPGDAHAPEAPAG